MREELAPLFHHVELRQQRTGYPAGVMKPSMRIQIFKKLNVGPGGPRRGRTGMADYARRANWTSPKTVEAWTDAAQLRLDRRQCFGADCGDLRQQPRMDHRWATADAGRPPRGCAVRTAGRPEASS